MRGHAAEPSGSCCFLSSVYEQVSDGADEHGAIFHLSPEESQLGTHAQRGPQCARRPAEVLNPLGRKRGFLVLRRNNSGPRAMCV